MNFYNQVIDKKGLKRIVSWFVENYGPTRTAQLIEDFQFLGFHYATRAGLSLGFDDLRIPPTKTTLLEAAQKQVRSCENNYARGNITALERYQKLIDIWTTTSENLKEEVIQNFQKTPLNPLYMMAFSGARGNISQVRQLVGMRGLMSDSGGGIIDFPIRSNFREGLSVTEYVISCYGARKGLIDTALRTADSGYLTRRLVDVAHAIMITEIDCGTTESISVAPLEKNLLGRVLAENIVWKRASFSSTPPIEKVAKHRGQIIARKNQDISAVLAREILQAHAEAQGGSKTHLGNSAHMIRVRSPLSCEAASANLCQMCYGWNLAQGRFVSIGDAVGILAAQSIGEPGTQLTMRTFHTGGIFSTDVEDKIFAPHDGFISYQKIPKGCKLRSVHGETGFFSHEALQIRISVSNKASEGSILQLPAQSLIFVYPGKFVYKNDLCAEISRLTPNFVSSDDEEAGELDSPSLEKVQNSSSTDVRSSALQKKVFSESPSFLTESGGESDTPSFAGPTDTPDESISELQGAAYKLVFSEIQGQVSLGYGGFAHNHHSNKMNSGGHSGLLRMQSSIAGSIVDKNEVWVLAAERLESQFGGPSAARRNSSRGTRVTPTNTLRTQFNSSSTSSSHLGSAAEGGGHEGLKFPNLSAHSVGRFIGYAGDLLYWKGRRASTQKPDKMLGSKRALARPSSSQGSSVHQAQFSRESRVNMRARTALAPGYQKKASSVVPHPFEVRDSCGPKAVLPFKEQKRPIPHIQTEKSASGGMSTSYVLGTLIRSHDECFKTEYSAQIIRKMSGARRSCLGGNLQTFTQKKTVSHVLRPSLVLRRVQPHLVSGLKSPLTRSNLRPLGSMVQEKDVLFQLLLPLQQSKTGDIVQGLPKIEQLFEGRGRQNVSVGQSMQGGKAPVSQPKLNQESKNPALRALQQSLVEEIQSVYQSQGVEIADKHIEIIVRLMTSKVKILEKGRTSFFPDDIVDLHHVRAANLPEAFYEPIVLGITKVAFLTESFVSAASFQETKRVLMNSALQNRVDFLHGLKENVIVGRLIPAGTGFVKGK